MKTFSIIATVDQNMGIGKNGKLPWLIPADLVYFSKLTTSVEEKNKQNAVIMGRKTWESLPKQYQPMPDRINAVISSNPDLDLPFGVLQFDTLESALAALETSNKIENIFVIGGGQLYAEAILHPQLERIYLTKLEEDFSCDTFFPDEIPEEFHIISTSEILESDGLEYSFVILDNSPEEEENEYIEFEN